MSDYVISCCTSADLSEAYIRKRDISYICMHYELDGIQPKTIKLTAELKEQLTAALKSQATYIL